MKNAKVATLITVAVASLAVRYGIKKYPQYFKIFY